MTQESERPTNAASPAASAPAATAPSAAAVARANADTALKRQLAEMKALTEAIDESQATIEFKLDGTIINANANFLNVMGYTLEEIVGRHHRIFVDVEHAASREYQQFWETLRSGAYLQSEHPRVAKNGSEVWIHASYNPILDVSGRPNKIIKIATDITERVRLQKKTAQQYEQSEQLTGEVIECANEFAEGARVIAESGATLSDGAQSQAA